MKLSLSAFLLAALLSGSALAQALTTSDYSTTVGTSAIQCVPPDSSRKTLHIENPAGNTNNICYAVNATPSCGALGTSVLVPGVSDDWALGLTPKESVNCIASGSGTPVTIRSEK